MYGAIGYGIDAALPAYSWSSRFSTGNFCLWHDTELLWVPDASFDHVISYWALYHLKPEETLCRVAEQLVSKLRPGGRAWFGGNDPSPVNGIDYQKFGQAEWLRCIGDLSRRRGMNVDVEFVLDGDMFRSDTYKEALAGDYLYLQPTYSVLVHRHADHAAAGAAR